MKFVEWPVLFSLVKGTQCHEMKKFLEGLCHIRISNSGGTSERSGNLISAFEKADSQSSACDFEK
jgi:hypothetical protein